MPTNWKKHQYKTRVKKKTKLALIVLAALIGLLLIYQLINFTRVINQSFRSEDKRTYSWNGESNINILFTKSPVSLFSYNPQEKKAIIVAIPDETYIDVPFGFGKWQVRAIYDLGKTSKLSGNLLLEQSISAFLGISIDGFSSVNLLDSFKGNLFSGLDSFPHLETNMTPLELIRLKIGLLSVRFDKVKKIDLVNLGILEKQNLADGTQVLVSDPIRVDSVLSDFADSQIQSEHLSVAIFNATNKPLLAQKAKRLITNLGGNVISVENAPKNIKNTYVTGQNSKTLKRLVQIFSSNCSDKCDKIPKEELGPIVDRAQIIVVLGQDF